MECILGAQWKYLLNIDEIHFNIGTTYLTFHLLLRRPSRLQFLCAQAWIEAKLEANTRSNTVNVCEMNTTMHSDNSMYLWLAVAKGEGKSVQ